MSKNKALTKTYTKIIIIIVLLLLIASSSCILIGKSLETPLQIYSEKPCPDAVYFGTSATYRYWMAPEAFMEQGITVYSYTAGAFSGFAYKHFINDLLKHQDPDMIIIEMRPFTQPEDRNTEHVQLALDYMPFSLDKYELLAEYLSYAHKYDMPIADNPKNYLPVQFRKDKTLEIVKGHIEKHAKYKGFPIDSETTSCIDYDPRPFVKGESDLPFDGDQNFEELMDYCDKLDCRVVFVASPFIGNPNKQKCINRMTEMAVSRGFDCYSFPNRQSIKDMGLDTHTDFYNTRHVNIKGALKYTRYFAGILKNTYHMTDHRGDTDYHSWQKAGEELRVEYKNLTESMQ